MQWFCKILQLNGLEVIQAKPHQLKRRWEVFETSQEEILRANCTNNSLEFQKACEKLNRIHGESTPHRSETHRIVVRVVRCLKEGISSVLGYSWLWGNWWAEAKEWYCNIRNVKDFLADGQTFCERRFNSPFDGPIILFWSRSNFLFCMCQDQCWVHQFGIQVRRVVVIYL